MQATSVLRRRSVIVLVAVTLLAVVLAPAPRAQAATTITTPWPVVEVEPDSDVTLTLEITADPTQRVDLEVVEAPDGWDTLLRAGGFVVQAVTAGADEPVEVDLEVHVPLQATEGANRIAVVASAADGSDDRIAVDLVVTEEVAGATTLDVEFPELAGVADDTFEWSLELSNALPGETTFALQAGGPPGWIVSARPSGEPQARTVTVTGGDTETVNVRADPPANVAAGSYDLVVVATGGGQRVEVGLVAVVEGVVGIGLTTADERLNAEGSSGQVTRVPLLVTNTGSSPLEDLSLRADPPADWEVSFEPETVSPIEPGESAEVVALVTPASDAITGDYMVGFAAEAEGRSAEMEVRFQVRTPLGWGAVGIGVIVAALAGLTALFRRYGRR